MATKATSSINLAPMKISLGLGALVLIGCSAAAPDVAPPLPPSAAPPSTSAQASGPLPPVAKKDPHTERVHGIDRVDDYYWLRKKGSPEVVDYLNAENAFTEKATESSKPFQDKLYKELLARLKETDSTPPVKRGGYLYYSRTEGGKQYPILCRKKGEAAPEQVMIDLNEIAKTEKFVDVSPPVASDDENLIAYGVDTKGFRQYVLKTKDLRTGKDGSEAIERFDSEAWAKDSKTLFYVTEDAQTKRPNKLFRHVLGHPADKDALVYEEKDEMFDLEVERSRDKAFVFVTSTSRTTSEVRTIDAAKPLEAPKLVAPREHDHEYYVDHAGGLFYIRTNSGGRNFRIVTVSDKDSRRDKWKEVLPTDPEVMIEDIDVFSDHVVLRERKEALPRVVVTDLSLRAPTVLEQPEPTFALTGTGNAEFVSKTYRILYQSFLTPRSWYDVDVKTNERKLVKRTEVPGGYDPSRYEERRVLAKARDGQTIPVSLVFKKGLANDGTHPLWLYGYGSYGIPTEITFNADRVSLLDRGVVFAIAHIRGSGDRGKKWHDAGRMMAKRNTFNDFIDAADWLVSEKWAKKDALVASGGSAGGLLMGAVVNMRPDLFKVVVASVPFVDVVNTMLDESLPLTVQEFEEWGNPKVKDQYDYMMTYSPYDNVKAAAYPAMLVRSSYNDSQVMYWEPAKWVSKLRATKTGSNPLLFKINIQPAGHGGQSGRYDRIHDTAFDYAFVLGQLGITE
jgi:oligopeptidase B